MKLIAGAINKQWLQNVLSNAMPECTRVRAAIAYATANNLQLFEACRSFLKPLVYYGRYDHGVPVDPRVLAWFLEQKSPGLICKLVPDILHAKVIWWEGAGAYIGSANLSERAWVGNIEAGVYVEHEQLCDEGLDLELEQFFDGVDALSRELTHEIYLEMKQLDALRASDIEKRDNAIRKDFEKTRRIPYQDGLVSLDTSKSDKKATNAFVQEWNRTLQLMRHIGARVSQDDHRPDWLARDVPAGVQADQFLHAYYYQRVKDGAAHPYGEFFEANKNRPEQALQEVMTWWKSGAYKHVDEERTVYSWSRELRALLAEDRVLSLTESEFCNVVSRVHAMRDYASKQRRDILGLESGADYETKIRVFAQKLFRTRSRGGKSPVETINFVLYGGVSDELPERLWLATHSETWKVPNMGLSSLGELTGWALPDVFPPRNMRTSKALRALGNVVTIYGS